MNYNSYTLGLLFLDTDGLTMRHLWLSVKETDICSTSARRTVGIRSGLELIE